MHLWKEVEPFEARPFEIDRVQFDGAAAHNAHRVSGCAAPWLPTKRINQSPAALGWAVEARFAGVLGLGTTGSVLRPT